MKKLQRVTKPRKVGQRTFGQCDAEAKKTRNWLKAQKRILRTWAAVGALIGESKGRVKLMAEGQRPVCESARVAYRKSKPGYVRRFIKKIGVPFLKAKVGISPTGRYGRGGRIIYDE